MRAILKQLHSPDIDNLEIYQPDDTDNFGFLIQVIVGQDDAESNESFDVMVCTPKWLRSNYQKTDVVFGLHHLIVFEYNYQRIYDKFNKYINDISDNKWDDIARKLAMIGHWEFQDYQP